MLFLKAAGRERVLCCCCRSIAPTIRTVLIMRLLPCNCLCVQLENARLCLSSLKTEHKVLASDSRQFVLIRKTDHVFEQKEIQPFVRKRTAAVRRKRTNPELLGDEIDEGVDDWESVTDLVEGKAAEPPARRSKATTSTGSRDSLEVYESEAQRCRKKVATGRGRKASDDESVIECGRIGGKENEPPRKTTAGNLKGSRQAIQSGKKRTPIAVVDSEEDARSLQNYEKRIEDLFSNDSYDVQTRLASQSSFDRTQSQFLNNRN